MKRAEIETVQAANQAFYEALSGRDMKWVDEIWSHEPHSLPYTFFLLNNDMELHRNR